MEPIQDATVCTVANCTRPDTETVYERFPFWRILLNTAMLILEACDKFRNKNKVKPRKLEYPQKARSIPVRETKKDMDLPSIQQQKMKMESGDLLNEAASEAALILLPRGHKITNFLITQAHINTLHGEPTLPLSKLRGNYWVPRGKGSVLKALRTYKKCPS